MDKSDINKSAMRKKMSDDAEKLREKLSRETAKIIKLMVAQDTANWDLKEKLQAVEGNHERLQKNMIEMQMQHDAISSAYHRELRQRPVTLNKLASTRKICDVLEEHTARVQDSLRRTAADVERLRAAYGEAGARAVRANAAVASAVISHRTALADYAAREIARATDEADRARQDATRRGDQLAAATAEKLHLRDTLQVREEEGGARIATLQRQLEEGGDLVAKLQRELDELRGREADERRVRREAETEVERLAGELGKDRTQLERSKTEVRELRDSVAALREEMVTQAERAAAELDAEAKRGRAALATLHAEAANLRAALDKTEATLREKKAARIQVETALSEERAARERFDAEVESERAARARVEATLDETTAARARLEAALEGERSAAAERAARFDADLAARDDAVATLMGDLTAEGEARARAEAALRGCDAALKDKDAELARQMKIILEVRAEKERLQEIMQATSDNIQKELTTERPPPARATSPAVRDWDKKPNTFEGDAMLYAFFSDSSMDEDPDEGVSEKQRRFAAMMGRSAARGRGAGAAVGAEDAGRLRPATTTIDNIQKELTTERPPPARATSPAVRDWDKKSNTFEGDAMLYASEKQRRFAAMMGHSAARGRGAGAAVGAEGAGRLRPATTTIDNIQKELTTERPPPARATSPAVRDWDKKSNTFEGDAMLYASEKQRRFAAMMGHSAARGRGAGAAVGAEGAGRLRPATTTIDNIQKELTTERPPPARATSPAVRDWDKKPNTFEGDAMLYASEKQRRFAAMMGRSAAKQAQGKRPAPSAPTAAPSRAFFKNKRPDPKHK